MTASRHGIGLFSVVFVLAGLAALAIAGTMIVRDPVFTGEAIGATGEVVDLKRAQSGSGVANYRPVVVFRDASRVEWRFEGAIGANPPDYRKGEQVAVLYDPAAPDQAVINSWSQRVMGPVLAGGFGALLLWLEVRAWRTSRRRRAPDAATLSAPSTTREK